MSTAITKNRQYFKFCAYGFLKNLRFFDAFFILFLMEKGLSFTEIGLLYAVREIFINIFEIPSGIIADTYGRKNSLVGSFLAYILSFYVFYISNEFWFFLLAFLLYGVGDAFRSGTHKGMIMDYLKLNGLKDQKIAYYGHTRSWSHKGSAISSIVAGIIVFYTGVYESIFIYSTIPYLINFFLILSYPKELNHSQKTKKEKTKLRLTVKSFFNIIRQKNVLQTINTSAVHTAYLKAVKDYIQPLMVSFALSLPFLAETEAEKKSGLIIGFIYFIIYLLSSRASKLAPKVYSKHKQSISSLSLMIGFCLGILSGLFLYYDLWVLSLIAFIGIFIIENIRKPILTGFVADQVPNEILTSVISAQSVLRTILTSILALSFGIIADYFSIGSALIFVSVILALINIIFIFARKKT